LSSDGWALRTFNWEDSEGNERSRSVWAKHKVIVLSDYMGKKVKISEEQKVWGGF